MLFYLLERFNLSKLNRANVVNQRNSDKSFDFLHIDKNIFALSPFSLERR